MSEKPELWWIAVGGNKLCEPARVVEINGKKQIYTVGCPDPLEESKAVMLVSRADPPDTPKEEARRERAWRRERAVEAAHRYRDWSKP